MKFEQMIEIPDYMIILHVIKNDSQCSASKINLEYYMTYSNVSKVINQMAKMKYIEKDMSGRQFILKLTPKGSIIADAIDIMLMNMGIEDDVIKKCMMKGKLGNKKLTEELMKNSIEV